MYQETVTLPSPEVVITNGMDWTPDEDEALRKRYKSETAAVLSKAMGRTRSAVLGRAYRLGLTGEKKAKKKDTGILVSKPKQHPYLTVQDGPSFMPRGGAVEMMELGAHDCRWPCGDKFCGARKVAGKSYCREHTDLAYPKEIQR